VVNPSGVIQIKNQIKKRKKVMEWEDHSSSPTKHEWGVEWEGGHSAPPTLSS